MPGGPAAQRRERDADAPRAAWPTRSSVVAGGTGPHPPWPTMFRASHTSRYVVRPARDRLRRANGRMVKVVNVNTRSSESADATLP